MTRDEQAFLALSVVGMFVVDYSTGRVYRKARWIGGSRTGGKPYMRLLPRPTLAETSESDGYRVIMFSDGTRRCKVFAHRVVWMLTKEADIPTGMQINHRDGKRINNKPGNLEVVTPAENAQHAARVLKTVPSAKARLGALNASARVTEEQVREIRALCAAGMAQSQVAARYGISQGTVSAIHLRKSWEHLA